MVLSEVPGLLSGSLHVVFEEGFGVVQAGLFTYAGATRCEAAWGKRMPSSCGRIGFCGERNGQKGQGAVAEYL